MGLPSIALEPLVLIASLLLLISVLASKFSDRYGVPALLIFLVLGMLAGSDGPGGIYFDNYGFAQWVGIIALVFILFAGGLDTNWRNVRPVFGMGLALSTIGVTITALLAGLFATWLFDFSLAEGLLIGAVVSSTDAAAVLSVLRSKGVRLKPQLQSLLELESGSNDPMAIFLTVSAIQLLTRPALSPLALLSSFALQMLLGAAIGYGAGRGLPLLINRLRLGYDGLYPVLTLAAVLLVYSLTTLLGGNGFLAVYLAGIVMGNRQFVHRLSLLNFSDGVAWLMQIVMFLILGLLAFPNRVLPLAGMGLLFTTFLMFIARPASVFLTLLPARRLGLREKTLLSWVGLRGAVPIILATYPFRANLPVAERIFDVVFFVVLTSVLLQGTTVPLVARWLGLEDRQSAKPVLPTAQPVAGMLASMRNVTLPANAPSVGKALAELGLPHGLLVVLIERDGTQFVPAGSTVLRAGDRLTVVAEAKDFDVTQTLWSEEAQAKRPARLD